MKLAFFLIPFSFFISIANAQTKPFVLGNVVEIHSDVLNENRTLNIYLPANYEKDKNSYPVIYLLDGSANEDFIHIVGLVQFMVMIEKMPPTIVVGIANVDRKRDFTFPTTIEKDKAAYPTTGSSANFIAFLEKDLQPYIKANYRTNQSRTIIGQSLGGLVATEILLKKPDLFSNYIIISPSLWWDNESLLAKAPQLLSIKDETKRQVYISTGAEGKVMENDAKSLNEQLKAKTNLTLFFAPLPEENHLTILHKSVYKAFEMLNTKK